MKNAHSHRWTKTVGVIAALGALVLAGCSSAAPAPAETSTGPSAEEGTIRVLVAGFAADDKSRAAFDSIVDTFHEDYPNIEVESDFAPYDQLNQKISTALAGGQNYDVISAGIGWVQPVADLGALQSLTKLGVTEDEVAANTQEVFVDPMLWDDEVYAFPVVSNARVLALSKSAFEEAGLDPVAPTSLKELREDAVKLTKRDAAGNITQTGFDFWASPGEYRQMWMSFMGALGGRMFVDGEPGFDGKEGVNALELMTNMINDDKSSTFGYKNSTKTPLVTTGEAAMGFTSAYADCSPEGLGDKCDDLVYFNLEDVDSVLFTGGRVVGVGEGTEHPEAALAFARAFSSPASQIEIAKIDIGVPLSTSDEAVAFAEGNPASAYVAANLDKAIFEYGSETFLDVRAKIGGLLDQALLKQRSAKDVLDELNGIARG